MGLYIIGVTSTDIKSLNKLAGFMNWETVEVSEPHGGLIDAEDLIKILDVNVEIEGEENARNVAKAFNEILDTIRGISPVIDAED